MIAGCLAAGEKHYLPPLVRRRVRSLVGPLLDRAVRLHGLPLRLAEPLRDDDLQRHVLVALRVVVRWELLHAIIRDLLLVIVLGAAVDLHTDVPIQRSDLNFRAKHCVRQTYVQIGKYVGAVALEVSVRLDLDLYHQVAGGPAADAAVALLRDAQVDAIVDALRNVDGLANDRVGDALAAAGGARTADDGASVARVRKMFCYSSFHYQANRQSCGLPEIKF